MTTPQRTCIGCRRADDRSVLRRFVAREGRLVADRTKSLPGRGCWLHADVACWVMAIKRRSFPRALRCEVQVPLDMPGE